MEIVNTQPAKDTYGCGALAAGERRVLIIESDTESVAALQLKLAQAGFKVRALSNGEEARRAIDQDEPHLVVLDWDLPAVIAMDLVRHMRRDPAAQGPRLIALSSLAGEQHVCSGFELGVDDYVVKPFSVPEVVARVRAVLRPMRDAQDETASLRFRELELDVSSGCVMVGTREVVLRNMEFRLLQFLMRNPERAYSRETLLKRVWGREGTTGLRAVDVTVQRVRRALIAQGCASYLQTIRGLGYRLSSDASSL